ncbi:MAG: hypothetical protein FWF53_12595 [Candidatus Azobacteroides sp.]|nr:hypothetical protein [Candidatus Azobacteroides sp.]
MKNIRINIFILLSSFLFSCSAKTPKTTTDILEDTVPFEYNPRSYRAILIPGTLNDSISLRYWLETGTKGVVFSDSLDFDFKKRVLGKKEYKTQKAMKVQIGQWEQIYRDSADTYYLDKSQSIFQWLGYDIAYLPWLFFDQKIIELSFSKQYLRELSDTNGLLGYDSVKIEIENGFLGIPVVASLQGEKIRELLMFDTGFNGSIYFDNRMIYKYDIQSDSAIFGKTHGKGGLSPLFAIIADTIKIGKYFVTEKHFAYFSLDEECRYPFSGLIGNKVLDNFDLVLDLKNYYLYLKPIEKH